MGVPIEEIPKFSDPKHWLMYFSPKAIVDLKKFGISVDWRRSFITTDDNQYYDKFIRWQFNRLKEKNLLTFQKRFSIFSTIDNQPCADHDRSKGEGVVPQEYFLVKLKVVKFPKALSELEGKFDVFFAACTLRPETMYGQTNCWILPTGTYGVYQINEKEAFVMTERSARSIYYL
jgi:leucyl-tRNA synthetase